VQKVIETIPGARTVSACDNSRERGVVEMVVECINSADVDIRKDLYSGVIVTGTHLFYPALKSVDSLQGLGTCMLDVYQRGKLSSENHL
jgi:hypothetical protein